MKQIMDFVIAGDVVMVIATTMEFLHSFNPESAYAQIDKWKRIADWKDGKLVPIPQPDGQVIETDLSASYPVYAQQEVEEDHDTDDDEDHDDDD